MLLHAIFLPADNHHVACKGAVADAEGDSTVMLSVRGTVGGREAVHSIVLPRLEET